MEGNNRLKRITAILPFMRKPKVFEETENRTIRFYTDVDRGFTYTSNGKKQSIPADAAIIYFEYCTFPNNSWGTIYVQNSVGAGVQSHRMSKKRLEGLEQRYRKS